MFGQFFIQEGCANREGYYSVGANYLCEINYEISVEDNFKQFNHSEVFKALLMMLSSLFIVGFGFGLKCLKDVSDKFLIFVCLFFLCNLLQLGLTLDSDLETCSFPRWCHEGINNTIVPSYYYFQRKECPRINAWIPNFYEDRLGIEHIDCDKTEYGCCEIREISCESSFREGDSYSFYKYIEERNVGHWTLNIEKEDEKGDNCPTIEEMILEISDGKSIFLEIGIIVGSNCILTLIVYLVFLNCIDGKYENVETEDNNGENKDEENPVLRDTDISSSIAAEQAEQERIAAEQAEQGRIASIAEKIKARKEAQKLAAAEEAAEREREEMDKDRRVLVGRA